MRARALVMLLVTASVTLTAADASAARAACPSRPFTGTIDRDADPTKDQPGADTTGDEIERAFAFDFASARNSTVYLATYRLDPARLGSTLEAPEGEVLVTVFLRPKSGELTSGKRLKSPKDQVTVLVDSGGGAQATTSGARASVRMLEFTDERVCFVIDYRDDLQHVKGSVRAVMGSSLGAGGD